MKTHVDDPDPILLSGPEQESFIRDLLQGDIAEKIVSNKTSRFSSSGIPPSAGRLRDARPAFADA